MKAAVRCAAIGAVVFAVTFAGAACCPGPARAQPAIAPPGQAPAAPSQPAIPGLGAASPAPPQAGGVRLAAAATHFDRGALEEAWGSGDGGRLLHLSSGVRLVWPPPGEDGDANRPWYATFGSRRAEANRWTVDGLATNGPEAGSPVPFEPAALAELQVRATENAPDLPVAATVVAGVLASGSDRFHGSGSFSWQTPRLQSSNVTPALRAQGVTGSNCVRRRDDLDAQVGGPLLRDRAWFRVSTNLERARSAVIGYAAAAGADGVYGTGDDVGGDVTVRRASGTAKVDAAAGRHGLTAFVQTQARDSPAQGAGPYRPREATYDERSQSVALKGEWKYAPFPRSQLTVSGSRWASRTDTEVSNTAPSRYDTVTLRYSGAYKTTSRAEPSRVRRTRWEYAATVGHHVPDLHSGSHDVKLGVEVGGEDLGDATSSQEGKDYLLRYQAGLPFEVYLYNVPFEAQADLRAQSAFVHDRWQAGDRVGIDLGVRLERQQLALPPQSKPAGRFSPAARFDRVDLRTWQAVAPRVAVVVGLSGKARDVLTLRWGRFNESLQAAAAEPYNRNALNTAAYAWADANGNDDFDEGEAGAFRRAGGGVNRMVNPGLRQPKVDEASASFERRLAAALTAKVSYVYRREHDLYQDVNVLRPFAAYDEATEAVDPGEDGRTGTPDDGAPVTYYDYGPAYAGAAFERILEVNTPGNRAVAHSLEVAANRRLSRGWRLLVSYLATRREGWRDGVPQDPNAQHYFPWSVTWEHAFKVAGSCLLPFGLQVAATFTHQSGEPRARDVRFTVGLRNLGSVVLPMEPLGARRLPDQDLLDVRLEKRQKVGRIGQVIFRVEVSNATNASAATGVTMRSGPSFGRVTSIVPPRIARLGVAASF